MDHADLCRHRLPALLHTTTETQADSTGSLCSSPRTTRPGQHLQWKALSKQLAVEGPSRERCLCKTSELTSFRQPSHSAAWHVPHAELTSASKQPNEALHPCAIDPQPHRPQTGISRVATRRKLVQQIVGPDAFDRVESITGARYVQSHPLADHWQLAQTNLGKPFNSHAEFAQA
ncbi:hypothetical protein WJX84_012422 [Apatococcus fuscideae]|uniref:Uncharacterized protein n=1 Tax=Apatococcus fuscideae TaxID=2026836 RepID=A0AAW1SYN2_9CHLO